MSLRDGDGFCRALPMAAGNLDRHIPCIVIFACGRVERAPEERQPRLRRSQRLHPPGPQWCWRPGGACRRRRAAPPAGCLSAAPLHQSLLQPELALC